jgi:hypothetical protein
MSSLPLLEPGPDSQERGRIHGKMLRAAACDNIETYLSCFEIAPGLGKLARQRSRRPHTRFIRSGRTAGRYRSISRWMT